MMRDEHGTGGGDDRALTHLLSAARLAIWPPTRLVIALTAVIATVAWTATLDWAARPDVPPTAIQSYIASDASVASDAAGPDDGGLGVFEAFRLHEQRCAGTALRLVLGLVPGVAPPSTTAPGVGDTVWRNAVNIVWGVAWLVSNHAVYSVLLIIGLLAIWAPAGGGICRTAALEFARGESVDAVEGVRFACRRFGALVLAILSPLVGLGIGAVCLYAFGLLLGIPWLGDLIGGALFGLALLGGGLMALLLVGLAPAAALAWPAIVVEDSDALGAIAGRGYAYAYQRPLKTILYGGFSFLVGGVCWLFFRFSVSVALRLTHTFVGAGTRWFGLGARGDEGAITSKLDAVWPIGGASGGYHLPDPQTLTGPLGGDYVSALLVGVWVMFALALTWAFIASFAFSAGTVSYFLLRRSVDGMDLTEIVDEADGTEGDAAPSASSGGEDGGTVQLSVVSDQAPPDSE